MVETGRFSTNSTKDISSRRYEVSVCFLSMYVLGLTSASACNLFISFFVVVVVGLFFP